MAYEDVNGYIDKALTEFFARRGDDIDEEDWEYSDFREWLDARAFDFDLLDDWEEAAGQLPALYAEWEDSLMSVEDVVEMGEQHDMEPDAIEAYVSTHWDSRPAFPLVFTSPLTEERWLCVDYKPLVADLLAWADFDTFRELEMGYVNKTEDEYLALVGETAVPYAAWLADNKQDMLAWFDLGEDFDMDADKFCLPGDKTQYSCDEPPLELFLEGASNYNLDAGDIDASDKIAVVRVPRREEVIDAMGRQVVITNCFMDFPYAASMNVLSLLEPEVINDLDDLLSFVAVDLLESTTTALVADAMTAPDPADYVAAQVAFTLQTRTVLTHPVITVEGLFDSAWEKISAHLPRYKRRAPAKKRERARANRARDDRGRGVASSVFDAMMGR